MYLVGGSATRKNDPDITLGSYILLSLSGDGPTEPRQQCKGTTLSNAAGTNRSPEHVTIGVTNAVAAVTNSKHTGASSQEGDVPAARIGHAAVVSPRSTIIIFGGEASTPPLSAPAPTLAPDPVPTPVNGQSLPPKLSDVYEGAPKEPLGTTITWRALINPAELTISTGGEGKADATGGRGMSTTTPPTRNTPGPRAFHAACSALIRGEWAMVVHGGVGDGPAGLLEDLWAFRLVGAGTTSRVAGHHELGDSKKAEFSWEHLIPDGTG